MEITLRGRITMLSLLNQANGLIEITTDVETIPKEEIQITSLMIRPSVRMRMEMDLVIINQATIPTLTFSILTMMDTMTVSTFYRGFHHQET